jgi:hypothetical protein
MVTKKSTARRRLERPSAPGGASKRGRRVNPDPTLWADIVAIGKSIPPEAQARVPADAATNFDDYIEGRRKLPR